MVSAADNQVFHINIKGIGYIIKRFKVWLNRITAPFTYSTIGLPICSASHFPVFCCSASTTFKSVEISHRVKYFNHRAKLYNLSDMDATSYNNYYQEVGIWLS